MTEERFEYHHQIIGFDTLIHGIFDNETQKNYSEEKLSDLIYGDEVYEIFVG